MCKRQEIQYAVIVAEDATSRALIDPGQISYHLTSQELGEKLGLTDEFRPGLLFRRRNLIDIRNLEDLPKAKWYEIFAALALAYVARSVNRGSGVSMEAMDSLGYAESLALISRANKASKSTGEKWKALLAEFVADRPNHSAPRIAKAFLSQFAADMEKDRPTSYSILVLTRWVRQLRKLRK